MVRPHVNCDKCKRNFTCVNVCPVGVFEKTDEGCVEVANPDKCIGCRTCEANCPENAIEVN